MQDFECLFWHLPPPSQVLQPGWQLALHKFRIHISFKACFDLSTLLHGSSHISILYFWNSFYNHNQLCPSSDLSSLPCWLWSPDRPEKTNHINKEPVHIEHAHICHPTWTSWHPMRSKYQRGNQISVSSAETTPSIIYVLKFKQEECSLDISPVMSVSKVRSLNLIPCCLQWLMMLIWMLKCQPVGWIGSPSCPLLLYCNQQKADGFIKEQ